MIDWEDVRKGLKVLGGMLAALLRTFLRCGYIVLRQLGLCMLKQIHRQRRKSIKSLLTPLFIIWGMLLMYQTYMLYIHEQSSSGSYIQQQQQIDRLVEEKLNERLRQQTDHDHGPAQSMAAEFQAFADARKQEADGEEDEEDEDIIEEGEAAPKEGAPDWASLRADKKFIVVQPIADIPKKKHKRHRVEPALVSPEQQRNIDILSAALKAMGYRQASSLSEGGLMWLVAPSLECSDAAVTTALNSIPGAISTLVAFCAGDANFVDHFNRKDVADQRLQWYDHKLHCPLYSTLVPRSFVVNPRSDLRELEASARTSGGHWIVKTQHGSSRGLPVVTRKVVSSVKRLRKSHLEGLLVQRYVGNPMLWNGKKMTLRVFAFIASSNPLRAFYHDGFVLRSLESYTRPRKKYARQANISTQQEGHDGPMDAHFGCFDGLQEQISSFARSEEASHYVDLVLKPYLKRLMVFLIYSMKRDHVQEIPTTAGHHLCFDFLIDDAWNVHFMDMRNRCPIHFASPAYTSTCKTNLLHAFGTSAINIMENLAAGRPAATKSITGTFEPLIDESNSAWDAQSFICKRRLYTDFVQRQTRSKRVVMNLFDPAGLPQHPSAKSMAMDRSGEPWRCPVCSYPNVGAAHFCDNCGSSSDPQKQAHPEATFHVDHPEHIDRHAKSREAQLEAEFAAALATQTDVASAATPVMQHEVVESSRECAGQAFTVHENAEIIATNLEPLRAASVDACCTACAIHKGCAGFSYEAAESQCWLKASHGIEGHKLGVVSGVVKTSPDSSTSSALDAASVSTKLHPHEHVSRAYFRERLIELFKRYDPAKLSRVDVLLDRYRGNEERYVLRMTQQYKAMEAHNRERSGAGQEKDRRGVTRAEYVDRLTHLFAKSDPSMIPHIQDMLDRFEGHEMELLQFMVQKYAKA